MSQEKFGIGLVHEAIMKLEKAGLTPEGLQRLVVEKEGVMAKGVVKILEKPTKLKELEKKFMAADCGGKHDLLNPHSENLSVRQFTDSNIPDEYLGPVWVSFQSKGGCSYKAVHVNYRTGIGGPYILLSSEDRIREDFDEVFSLLLRFFEGTPGNYNDRGNDICMALYLPSKILRLKSCFTKKKITSWVYDFYSKEFDKVIFERVHFHDLPLEIQAISNIPLVHLS